MFYNRKPLEKSQVKWWEIRLAGHGQVQIFEPSTSASIKFAQVGDVAESPKVTLDNQIIQFTQKNLDKWLDMSAWFVKMVNHVLDYFYFRKDSLMIVRAILKLDKNFKADHHCCLQDIGWKTYRQQVISSIEPTQRSWD